MKLNTSSKSNQRNLHLSFVSFCKKQDPHTITALTKNAADSISLTHKYYIIILKNKKEGSIHTSFFSLNLRVKHQNWSTLWWLVLPDSLLYHKILYHYFLTFIIIRPKTIYSNNVLQGIHNHNISNDQNSQGLHIIHQHRISLCVYH